MHASPRTRSSRTIVWNAIPEWCRCRVRDRKRRGRARLRGWRQFGRLHREVSERSIATETRAIERYRPSLIVWASTEEGNSIVASTSSGTKVLDPGSAAWKEVMLQRMDASGGTFVATGAKVVLLLEPALIHHGSQTQPNPAISTTCR